MSLKTRIKEEEHVLISVNEIYNISFVDADRNTHKGIMNIFCKGLERGNEKQQVSS